MAFSEDASGAGESFSAYLFPLRGMNSSAAHKWVAYLIGPLCIAVAAALLRLPGFHINSTTAALAFLLLILFTATRWGSFPALLTSLLAMLCFNFFFLPPFGTLSIANPDNWVALVAFLLTAITAGQLSVRAKQRAEEAEAGKREIERLFAELRDAFERASHAEALRQSEKLKTALLDAVTHDLRTPLASIKASITTLLDEIKARGDERPTLDAEARTEMMEVIDEETDRLNRFIDGLIELARIEAGELQLRRSWGAGDEIIANALTRALPFTKERKVEVEIEPDLPVARVDERAVSEVIYTLVENASKYSPPGTTIRITAKRADSDNLIMYVDDSGSGIDPELRERVFDKFFRATRDGAVIRHQASGNGMGLAIARGIVEAHNGRIWIESGEDNRGTRVLFTLPIGDSNQ